MKTLTKEDQEAIIPIMALNLLEEGNKRFVNNLKITESFYSMIKSLQIMLVMIYLQYSKITVAI